MENQVAELRDGAPAPIFTNTAGLARRYCVSTRTIQNWLAAKVLPVVRLGRIVRFDIVACDEVIRRFERKAARR
jgi:hypothetical protein